MSNVCIPVSYLQDDDGCLILLTDDERSRLEDRAAELDDAKAAIITEALKTDGELRALPSAVHATFEFRKPTTQDRLLIRHTAYAKAEVNGPVTNDWIYDQYVRIAAVEKLYAGSDPIPDALLEHVSVLLESALAPGQDVTRFLLPKATSSDEATP